LAVDRAAPIVRKDDKIRAETLAVEIGFNKVILGNCAIIVDDGEGIVQGDQGGAVCWGKVFSLEFLGGSISPLLVNSLVMQASSQGN